jgi:hypothetical protein
MPQILYLFTFSSKIPPGFDLHSSWPNHSSQLHSRFTQIAPCNATIPSQSGAEILFGLGGNLNGITGEQLLM